MARVLVSAAARQDIRDILSDLDRRAGHAVAARYAANFKRVYKSLAAFPESGSPRSSLGINTRIKIAYPFIVIYDADADDAMVLRVLDGRREVTEKLLSR